MARKVSPVDDVWALFQTLTVRDIAKKLHVDRRTVQRWKNQGQQPIVPNQKKLHREAQSRRERIRDYGKSGRERWQVAPLPVQLMGKRQYVTEEIKPTRSVKENKKAWEAERARSLEAKRIHDRFYKRKDRKGRTRFYRAQDAQAVVFDTRRARESDILALLRTYQGEGRAVVMVHALTKEYKMKDGTILPAGTHMGSRPESLDGLDLEKFVTDRKRKGKLVFLRVTELGTG